MKLVRGRSAIASRLKSLSREEHQVAPHAPSLCQRIRLVVSNILIHNVKLYLLLGYVDV